MPPTTLIHSLLRYTTKILRYNYKDGCYWGLSVILLSFKTFSVYWPQFQVSTSNVIWKYPKEPLYFFKKKLWFKDHVNCSYLSLNQCHVALIKGCNSQQLCVRYLVASADDLLPPIVQPNDASSWPFHASASLCPLDRSRCAPSLQTYIRSQLPVSLFPIFSLLLFNQTIDKRPWNGENLSFK